MAHDENKILTLKEVAQELRLDPRTVKEVAFALGGRRIGYRWRFRWGTVLEYGREKAWPGMAGRKRMGGRAKKARTGRDDDPHGIRTAYGVG